MERIKWKKISSGMTIGCRTEKETMALMEHLEELGYHWISGQRPTEWKITMPFEAFAIRDSKCILYAETNKVNIWFTDLVEKEEISPSVSLQSVAPDIRQTFPDNFLKWRKIIPGMVIECQNELETKNLLQHLEILGYRWKSGDRPTKWKQAGSLRIFCLNEDGSISWCCSNSYVNTRFIDLIEQETADDNKIKNETPDTSELSAKEVLEWLATYQGTSRAKKCFGEPCDIESIFEKFTAEEIVGKITNFEAEKNKDTSKHEDPKSESSSGYFSQRDYNHPKQDENYTSEGIVERITDYETKKKLEAAKQAEMEWVSVCEIINTEYQNTPGNWHCEYRVEISSDPAVQKKQAAENLKKILGIYGSEYSRRYIARISEICRVKEY